jgi:hypothetical protein
MPLWAKALKEGLQVCHLVALLSVACGHWTIRLLKIGTMM